MKLWIPGWELRERWIPWDITYYDIVDIIVNGELTAYNPLNQTPIDADIEKQTRDEIEFLKSKIGLMGLALGGKDVNSCRKDVKEELIRSITLGLDGFLFKIPEVEEYERTHGLIPQRNQAESTDPSALSQIDRVNIAGESQQMQDVPEGAPAQQERSPENVFIHEDDFWKISFQRMCLKPIKHSDGMTYIAHLITKGSIHVSNLYETAHPKSGEETIMPDGEIKKALAKGEMRVSNMNIPTLDPKSKENYKKYIQERRDIIDDPDIPETERKKAEEDINAVVDILRKEYGRSPLSRKVTVRQNEIIKGDSDKVRKSIKLAIETIQSHSTELADYLRCNIKSGTIYRFIGAPDVWQIIT